MHPFNLDKLFRLFIVLATIITSLFVLKMTLPYIYPFIIAMLSAFLLHPMVSYTERNLKLNRSLATWIVMGTLCFILFTVFFIFTERMVTGFMSLATNLPKKIDEIKMIVLEIGQAFYERLLLIFPFLEDLQFTEQLDHFMDRLSTMAIDKTTDILFTASNVLSSLSYLFIIVIFILIAVYMLTKDYHLFKATILKIIPQKIVSHFRPVIKYTKQSFFGLMKAQILITAISSCISLVFFYIFQIEHYFTLAIIIFFVDFIPYIGIGVIFVPWIIFLFITGQYVLTIQLASLYSFVLILRQLIEPRIIAREIGLHPFIALSILFIGYQAIGFLGILLTPFILILVSALHKARMFTAIYDYVYKK